MVLHLSICIRLFEAIKISASEIIAKATLPMISNLIKYQFTNNYKTKPVGKMKSASIFAAFVKNRAETIFEHYYTN